MNNSNLAYSNKTEDKIKSSPILMLTESDSLSRIRSMHIMPEHNGLLVLISSLQVVRDYRWHEIKESFDNKEMAISSAKKLIEKHLEKNPEDSIDMEDWIDELSGDFNVSSGFHVSLI